jgi:phosphatidylethanolamine-binding protein (PEBP) family uncharacterized protein
LPMRRRLAYALVLPVAALVAACGSSGRALTAPTEGATAPARNVSTTTTALPRVAPGGGTAFALKTTAWTPGDDLPRVHTCNGDNVSPALIIERPPAAAELALVAASADGTEVNWVVGGIPVAAAELAEGVVPAGAAAALSSNGAVGWSGPCPPEGGGTREYIVTLYALSSPSGVAEGMATAEALARVTDPSRVITTSAINGTFSR